MNLFKTHYSVGKSILTLDKEGEKSVFQISKNLGLEEIFLVENSMSGFAEAYFNSRDLGIPIRFGVLLKTGEDSENVSKIGVFALNTQGYKDLVKLFSKQETKSHKDNEKFLTSDELKGLFTENLQMFVPFYDGFFFQNLLNRKQCVPTLINPVIFVEDHNLPFDGLLRKAAEEFAKTENLLVKEVNSCYYPSEDYFDAWQVAKIMHNRGYRKTDLSCPNLDHCGSTTFYPKP